MNNLSNSIKNYLAEYHEYKKEKVTDDDIDKEVSAIEKAVDEQVRMIQKQLGSNGQTVNLKDLLLKSKLTELSEASKNFRRGVFFLIQSLDNLNIKTLQNGKKKEVRSPLDLEVKRRVTGISNLGDITIEEYFDLNFTKQSEKKEDTDSAEKKE